MSVVLSQGKVQQQAGLSVMKMALGVESTNGDAIAALAGQSAQPYLGANVDTQV